MRQLRAAWFWLLVPFLLAVGAGEITGPEIFSSAMCASGEILKKSGGGGTRWECAGDDTNAAAGGDAVRVDTTSVSDADLVDTASINFTLSAGPTPDQITADVLAVDGIDAGAGATRAGEQKIRIPSANSDCTSLTDGVAREVCFEEDSRGLWVCQPTAGDCDTAAEWVPANAYGRYIADGTNFVGIVRCSAPIVGSGSQENCRAAVTSFGGEVFDSGWVELAGTYNAASPHATSGGFNVIGAVFDNECNDDADGCGAAYEAFQTSLSTVVRARTDSAQSFPNVPVRFLAAQYDYKNCKTFHATENNITMDGTAHPVIVINSALDCATALPNVTITVGTSATTINFASTVLGAGTGEDGDEIARPGMTVLLADSGSWDGTGRKVILHTIATDGLSAAIWPPQTSDYSGTAEVADGRVFDLDPTNTNGGINMTGMFHVVCVSNCLPANTYDGTSGPTYRTTPLTVVAARPGWDNHVRVDSAGFCHKEDVGVLATSRNTSTNTTGSGEFDGGRVLSCATTNGSLYQLTGNDKTTSSDDGLGMAFRVQTPGFEINGEPGWGISNNIAYGTPGPNCGNQDIDAGGFEDTHQLLYAPRGCQNIAFHNISRENGMGCSGANCPDAAARRAFIYIGDWNSNPSVSGFGASYSFIFEKVFFGSGARPFLQVVGATRSLIHVEGMVEDTTDLLNIDNNGTVVYGHLGCEDASAGACDLPANGTYPDLVIFDETGAKLSHIAAPTTLRVPSGTAFPASPATGDAFLILDATSNGTCDSVGGTGKTLCVWSGAAWLH